MGTKTPDIFLTLGILVKGITKVEMSNGIGWVLEIIESFFWLKKNNNEFKDVKTLNIFFLKDHSVNLKFHTKFL